LRNPCLDSVMRSCRPRSLKGLGVRVPRRALSRFCGRFCGSARSQELAVASILRPLAERTRRTDQAPHYRSDGFSLVEAERRQRIPRRQSALTARRTGAAAPSARVEHHGHEDPRKVLLGSRIASPAPINLTAALARAHAQRGLSFIGRSRGMAPQGPGACRTHASL
jgi:hypothetical protein